MDEKEIKMIMKENPFINAEELAEKMNVSVTKVRYHIRAMKKSGEIQRVGSTKAGTWQILKQKMREKQNMIIGINWLTACKLICKIVENG